MKDIIKLALRNLKEHKSKTIIISMFILFGVAIVVMGNSFLESVNRGLENDFRANVTGDLAISVIPEKGTTIDLFGVNSTNITTEVPQIPALTDIDKIEKILAETDGIKKQSKLISAQVILSKDAEIDFSVLQDDDKDLGIMDLPISMLFAGESGSYWELFPDLKMIEGHYPTPGSNEIIVDTRVIEGFYKAWDKTLEVGDDVLLASMGGVIREGKVVGIFKPANEYSAMFQSVYCEPGLARSFAELTYANSFSQELPDTVDLSISEMSEDDFFGGDDFFDDFEEDTSILGSTSDFDSILGDTSLRDELNKTDDGAWQFIVAKLNNPHADKKLVAQLNKRFKDEGVNALAMDWKKAAYSYSASVDGIGFIFNLLIIILAIVVFIIIMNTMVVSVIERTSEIGTMRAIGAEKKFVKKLFYSEAIILTTLSSIAGVIFAFICMMIFNSFNITITNTIAKMILGGGLLHFSPTPKIIIITIVIALIGSIISNRYPVKSALRITPIKALSKE
ncbi:putative ABC transport system permease protein [Treponema bryantii]|uniref:Putative ABC transport system permease protein n=1 Tax=Treponema bryantii TaxID=163 RepID=A0A1H9HP10_9SPIR|nr:FtsX-like permease family protein [Treponema bryantii]SEQ63996.1 putative ABC transport system permease protein [Treponema bryantii]